ncbi:sigma 54-interacting transcriptional regulator [Brevibacillus sp. NRS-1366]|uniref:sigma 54-interacting transcriptional regulator n=1 Tax=Brevibacillus sp. NRS-1366 TaxID=3233899 RepID=UPI003D21EFC4
MKFLKRFLSSQRVVREGHNGTIFLDEIGDLTLHLLQKLLWTLEYREVERVGGVTPSSAQSCRIPPDKSIFCVPRKNRRQGG